MNFRKLFPIYRASKPEILPGFRTLQLPEKSEKRFLKPMLILLILMVSSLATMACEVHFNVSGEPKESYQSGDVFILEVKIVYTHRECEIQLADTKFLYKGIKILGATNWKELTPSTFVRQIKIQVTDEQAEEANLSITRKCSKEGVIGKFVVKRG